jgi:hypothetical protein
MCVLCSILNSNSIPVPLFDAVINNQVLQYHKVSFTMFESELVLLNAVGQLHKVMFHKIALCTYT